MKIMLFLCLGILLAMAERIFAPIPLPRNHLIDLDPATYTPSMLQEALNKGLIFTFLAKYHLCDEEDLQRAKDALSLQLNIDTPPTLLTTSQQNMVRIAMLLDPKRLGRYTSKTAQSVIGYLLIRAKPFEFKLYRYPSNQSNMLKQTLQTIEQKHTDLIIAPVTVEDAQKLCQIDTSSSLYIPTIDAERLVCNNPSISWGGIDYHEQYRTLLEVADTTKQRIIIQDHSPSAEKLTQTLLNISAVDRILTLDDPNKNQVAIRRFGDFNHTILFLNLPPLRSSLFLSQLTLKDDKPSAILTTQINYHPLLLTLTQYHDREMMIIANQIAPIPSPLHLQLALIGQDISFEWLNFTTLVGLDRLVGQNEKALLQDGIFKQANGYHYPVRLYRAGLYRFVPFEPYPSQEIFDTSPNDSRIE